MSDSQSDYDPIIDEAKQFLKLCNDADTMNRQQGLEDLKFVSAGEQWPVELQNSRNLESRPILTINKLDGYCRQVTNQQRQQRPRIKVHGMNNQANAKTAEVIEGICRHIEVQSNADNAYDTAFDYAVRMGWGYIRLITKYVSDDSFDQEIYIDAVDNPFTVYFDPNSTRIDGNDAERCLITTMISKEKFKVMYPGFDDGNGTSFSQRGTGDSQSEWITKEDIRVAEYYYVVMEKAKLYLLSDGTTQYADGKDFFARVEAAGLTIENERESYKRTVKYKKLTAIEVIEERDWPSKYIPIVPVYGRHVVVGDKRHKFGIVRHAKDAQRMYNFWQTTITESVALAPKAKWLMAEGQDEGHENEWAAANVKSFPLLRYKQTDIDGNQAPAPQRLQPEPPPAGVMAASQAINQDIATLMGIFDPSQQLPGNISGKALNGQQQQVDLTNFDFYDNLTKSIAHVGKIILDLVPKIYDTQRVMRIIGDDGKPDLVTINEAKQDEQGVYQVMHDMTVGQYDVVMETGPGYNSKREAAVEAMMPLLNGNQQLFGIAGDLVFRNMDFPGAETIADRLAASNPLAQIDEKSDIPPQVQMQLMQAKKQVQEMQQQMQAMQLAIKQRQDIEQVKQDAETKRTLIKETNRGHEIELRDKERHTDMQMKVNAQAHDTVLKTQTQLEIEQMKAQVAILLAHMDRTSLKNASAETTERAI
jgi:Phage P22-like portal protein